MTRTHRRVAFARLALPVIALVATFATSAFAAESKKAPTKTKAPAEAAAASRTTIPSLAALGLPEYHEPAAYSVDLVVHSEDQDLLMKRFIDHGRIRSEISAAGHDMVMIEMNDEAGTMITLMPEEKRAIKQTRSALQRMNPEMAKVTADAAPRAEAKPAKLDVEDLGQSTIDGRAAKKLRITAPEGQSLGWFDAATGAPIKIETKTEGKAASVEWKNYEVGPQPAKLYEVPKGYETMDMDEMMAQTKGMGGTAALGGMMGGMGMPGMGGMGANAMAGRMGQSAGSNFGGGLGSALGASLGGPLGAIAGQYIGGQIGGMIGKKAAEAVVPGK